MKLFKIIFISAGAIILTGCAGVKKQGEPIAAGVGAQLLSSYTGPKAQLAVADFKIEAAKASEEIGVLLREKLVAGLINTNRFKVVEKEVLAANRNSGLMILARLTEFEPEASCGSSGIGGGGGAGSGAWGGLLGIDLNKTYLALEIRISDASTSDTLASTLIEGQASDAAGAFDTSMEKAIRICIIEAIKYIAQTAPAGYYKY